MPKVPIDLRIERGFVRLATPYLDVETCSIASLERTIARGLAEAGHTAHRNEREDDSQPSSVPTGLACPP
jgi:hypothetical protein